MTIQPMLTFRSKPATCLLATFILLTCCPSSRGQQPAIETNHLRPNVVVLFIDDMGYADPSCFGNPAMKTPNIDRLANEGIRLTNFYVNSPICSASRVALTTGQYQQRHRIHSYLATRESNRDRQMPDWLDPSAPTLAKLLKRAGYRTAHFGKWHMGGGRDVGDAPLPQEYGFDESLVSFEGLGDRILWQKTGNQEQSWEHGRGEILDLPKHKTTETYVDRSIDFITRNHDQPFYLRVFPNDVHDGHAPSDEQHQKWVGTSKNPPDIEFFAVLDEMDRQIGRLLTAIDDLQLADDTLILFTSDNGPTDWPRYYKKGFDPPGFTGPLFGRKWSLYEGGIRMPFIARWPGKIAPATTDDRTVMAAIDVLPTIASICGVEPTEPTDGIDMSGALLGMPTDRDAPIFWEYGVHGSIQPGNPDHISPPLAMRDGRWKLLMHPDGTSLQLFDLKNDIGEQASVAQSHPTIVNAMKPQLEAWWKQMSAYYDTPKGRSAE
ncbi:sulfatase-like hydrolase/transferase [Rubripirellula lacrimiformis]|nr:sulfatase-like hydrolase/transferase [Rubripirellula lacrimiformis]